MAELVIATEDPRTPDVRDLLRAHLTFARSVSPPEDAHALDLDGLLHPDVTFFTARSDGRLVAVGALKRIDPAHAEIKSMHTIVEARGRGIGRAMLARLIDTARARGFRRVSLETGSMDAFAPARSLYAGAGFTVSPPFARYRESSYSTFMTLTLDGHPE